MGDNLGFEDLAAVVCNDVAAIPPSADVPKGIVKVEAGATDSTVSGDGADTDKDNSSDKGSSSLALTTQKKTKDKPQCICKVCGFQFVDMPKGSVYCYECKTDVDCYTAQLKTNARKLQTDEAKQELSAFEKIRDAAGLPPSDFSVCIITFRHECPSRGKGKQRAQMRMYLCKEVHEAVTGCNKGTRCVMMHKERAKRWARENLDMTDETFESWWADVDNKTSPDDKDEKGPAHSKKRLPIPCEDYIDGYTGGAHKKLLELEGKKAKITNATDLDELQKGILEGHAGFSDDLFSKVGGDAIALALGGGIGATPLSRTAGSPAKLSETIKADTEKSHEFYDVAMARGQLLLTLDKGIKDIGAPP